MKKIPFPIPLVLVLVLLTSALKGYGQLSRQDSLYHELKDADGKQRVDVLNQLAWELKYNNLSKSFVYTRQALNASHELAYSKGLMKACRGMAANHFISGQTDSAIFYAKQAIALAEKISDQFELGKNYNLLGISYRTSDNLMKALEYQDKAIEAFHSLGDSSEIYGSMHNKATTYEMMMDYHEALKIYQEVLDFELRRGNDEGISRTTMQMGFIAEKNKDIFNAFRYFKNALDYAQKSNNIRWEAAAIHHMANLYCDLDSLDKALGFYYKALELNRKNGYRDYIANNLISLGDVYFYSLEDFEKAEAYYLEAMNLYLDMAQVNQYTKTLVRLGELYRKNNELEKAKSFLDKAMVVADSNGLLNSQKTIFFERYAIADLQNNADSALENLERYLMIRDQMEESEKQELLEVMQAKYDFREIQKLNKKLEAENKLQEYKNQQQEYLIIAAIVLILIVLAFSVILLRGRRKLVHLNRLLQQHQKEIKQQKMQLEDSLKTKDKFFSIIAHDLKNPFTGILGFTYLIKEKVQEYKNEELIAYARHLDDASNELFQLLENLLKWARSHKGDLQLSVQSHVSLTNEIKDFIEKMKFTAQKKHIRIESQLSHQQQVDTDLNVLNTMLRNLLNNAIKYSEHHSEIVIGTYDNENQVVVFVRDYGVGMSEDIQNKLFKIDQNSKMKGTDKEYGTGLGLLICDEMIRLQDGKIWFESKAGQGSTFYFSLKASGDHYS